MHPSASTPCSGCLLWSRKGGRLRTVRGNSWVTFRLSSLPLLLLLPLAIGAQFPLPFLPDRILRREQPLLVLRCAATRGCLHRGSRKRQAVTNQRPHLHPAGIVWVSCQCAPSVGPAAIVHPSSNVDPQQQGSCDEKAGTPRCGRPLAGARVRSPPGAFRQVVAHAVCHLPPASLGACDGVMVRV